MGEFIAGIEIHQRLDTNKLFCKCESEIREFKGDKVIFRKQRAVAGELGIVDKSAIMESTKSKLYKYHVTPGSCCTVEMDEEPPHLINQQALEIALKVSMLLNAKIVDEIQIMRKTVIDGSNTSGFQRTALIATGGHISTSQGHVRIKNICLEEESAGIVSTSGDEIAYRLDRLAIPLIEIGTEPDIKSPAHAKEVAYLLGMILRSTGEVKRGIGTIRQDLNISIKGGARVEIKGAQDLALIPALIENEVERQKNLIKIKEILAKRGPMGDVAIIELTDIFVNTESKLMRKILRKKGKIFGIVLKNFAGIIGYELQKNRRLGTEFADIARLYGVKGIIHSDEDLEKYGFNEKEIQAIKSRLLWKKTDCFVITGGREVNVKRALKAIINRAIQATKLVPKETRRALADGTTSFLRPLPGAARMYPETDIPAFFLDKQRLIQLRKKLPELIIVRAKKISKKYNLDMELAKDLAEPKIYEIFSKYVTTSHLSPSLLAKVLIMDPRRITIEYRDNLKLWHLETALELLSENKLAKEAIPEFLEYLAKNPKISPISALKALKLEKVSESDLDSIIEDILHEKKDFILEKGDRAFKPIMGLVMKKVRGKIDGRLVSCKLKEKLSVFLSK
jgi:glutamyl-tRNA(Gln) amidotransferase subunit E